jgi:hypothetical protein
MFVVKPACTLLSAADCPNVKPEANKKAPINLNLLEYILFIRFGFNV